jgi:hypothetical protein
MEEDFDFGFTAVDEDELDVVQTVQTQIENSYRDAQKLEDKVNRLYNAILPLLANLKKNPEKDFIKWPNRTAKIEQFEDILKNIIES